MKRSVTGLLPTLSLRPQLAILVTGAVLPLLLLSVAIVGQEARDQRAVLDQGMRNTVHALSLAIDGEVKASQAMLEALAASSSIDAGDLESFHAVCARALQGRTDAYIILFDRSGQQLVNSSRPFGSPLPNPIAGARPAGTDARYPDVPIGGADAVTRVLETGRPAVSDLFVSLVTGRPRISVDVPIFGSRRVRYVLELSFDPRVFTDILMAQQLPPDSIASVVDRKGVAIARTLNAASRVGRPLAAELAAHIARGEERSEVGRTSEGLPVYHVFARSASTGWTMSFVVLRATADAPLRRSIALLVTGVAAAVLMAAVLAFVIGRRIVTPIATLARAAGSLARGEGVDLAASTVREVKDLHDALVVASGAVHEAAMDRARREAAEVANRTKDQFLAVLSHELRQPLNAILGWTRMLRSQRLDALQQERALETIERNTRTQARMIDDLLDIARIEAGKLALDRRPIDLGPLIAETVEALQQDAKTKEMTLETVLDPAAAIVSADADRLRQVFLNLLTNALKYTPAGGRVTVRMAVGDGLVQTLVADTGIGIDPELLPHVFERFRQADVRAAGSQGGLGLGLAIVREIVDMHGGSVEAHSEGRGRGTTFVVTLPTLVD